MEAWQQIDIAQLRTLTRTYPAEAIECALDAAEVFDLELRERGRQAILNGALFLFFARHQRGRVKVSEQRAELKKLQTLLDEVKRRFLVLDVDTRSSLERAAAKSPHFDELDGGDLQIQRMIETLEQGSQWVAEGLTSVPKGSIGRGSKAELQDWQTRVSPIYEEITGRKAAVSSQAIEVADSRAMIQADRGRFLLFAKILLAPFDEILSGRQVKRHRRDNGRKAPDKNDIPAI